MFEIMPSQYSESWYDEHIPFEPPQRAHYTSRRRFDVIVMLLFPSASIRWGGIQSERYTA